MRADKFVHEHLDYLDGKIKLTSCQKDTLSVNYEQQDQVTFNYSANFTEVQTDQSQMTILILVQLIITKHKILT